MLQRPTYTDIYNRVRADLEARLGPADLPAPDRHSLACVVAGAMHGFYGRQDYVARQMIPTLADWDGLVVWAGMYGIYPKAASVALGNVAFTGVNGSVIPAGTPLNGPTGLEYQTTVDVTIAAGVASAPAQSVVAGASGNLAAGAPMMLVSPVAGVQSKATVDVGGFTGGADMENVISLAARMGRRLSSPPHGGKADDYVTWALAVGGVTRAWAYSNLLGPGTVGVTFVCDGQAPGSILPSSALVNAVQVALDAQRPLCAALTVFSPAPIALNLTIQLVPNTAAVQAAVTAALGEMLRLEGYPGALIWLSHINEAISLATGETNHYLLSPTADIQYQAGQIPVLGTITWQ